MEQDILIPTKPLRQQDLERFRNAPFESMIKFVVDVDLRRIALGGEMQADAEEQLLLTGSLQRNLWGGNLWPWEHPPRVEYISLINIRPSQNNRSMELRLEPIRSTVNDIVRAWVELG